MGAVLGEVCLDSSLNSQVIQGHCQTPKFGLRVGKITRPLSWFQRDEGENC